MSTTEQALLRQAHSLAYELLGEPDRSLQQRPERADKVRALRDAIDRHLSAGTGTAGEVSDATLKFLAKHEARPLAVRMVWALRTAIRNDCGAGASREAFSAATKAEEDLIAEIERLSSTPIQGARMLTDEEAADCECGNEWATAKAIQRKFASVNGIQLAPTGAEGGQHG